MTQAETEVKLNYIDKVTEALKNAGTSRGRVALIVQGLSAIVLAASVGVVSVEDKLSIAGAEIGVSEPAFYYGSSIVITALVAVFYALDRRMISFRNEIRRLYKNLHYDVASNKELNNPFESTDAYGALLGELRSDTQGVLQTLYTGISTIILGVLFAALPFATQILVVVTLVQLFGLGSYGKWVPAVLLVILTVVTLVHSIVRERQIS